MAKGHKVRLTVLLSNKLAADQKAIVQFLNDRLIPNKEVERIEYGQGEDGSSVVVIFKSDAACKRFKQDCIDDLCTTVGIIEEGIIDEDYIKSVCR